MNCAWTWIVWMPRIQRLKTRARRRIILFALIATGFRERTTLMPPITRILVVIHVICPLPADIPAAQPPGAWPFC